METKFFEIAMYNIQRYEKVTIDFIKLFNPSVSCSKLIFKVNQNLESGTTKKNASMYVVFDQKSMIAEHEIAHQSPGSKPVILTGLGRC